METEQCRIDQELPFKKGLESILDSRLTVDNIDNYTESALSELISLSNVVTSYFMKEKGIDPLQFTGGEIEDMAFEYYNLQSITTILERVYEISHGLSSIDGIIARIPESNIVIVPPDELDTPISPGTGTFAEKEESSRLKTVLFVLRELGIDLSEVTILKGKVDPNMVRKHPYYEVRVASLNRRLLVCDEVGNATFVLDDTLLEKAGIKDENLLTLTKEGLKRLIESRLGLGRVIIYSEDYVQDIIASLRDSLSAPIRHIPGADKYFYPKAPEGILSVKGMYKEFGVSDSAISGVIEELGEELGEVGRYRFGPKLAYGYTPAQQGMISEKLREKGLFTESAPEGILSVKGMYKEFGVSNSTIPGVIKELGEKLGEVGRYRFGSRLASGYNSAQQGMISEKLREKGLFTESAPEGILSIQGMCKEFGVSGMTISGVIKELGEELGEVGRYRFGPKPNLAFGYNSAQQGMISEKLRAKGLFAESVPEGILSVKGMYKEFGVSGRTISGVIKELGEGLGEVGRYRFGPKLAYGYNSAQQGMISEKLREKGYSIKFITK